MLLKLLLWLHLQAIGCVLRNMCLHLYVKFAIWWFIAVITLCQISSVHGGNRWWRTAAAAATAGRQLPFGRHQDQQGSVQEKGRF